MPLEAANHTPNRWLHVRLPRPFSDTEFGCFCAQAEIWCKYVQATLDVWSRLGQDHPAPSYQFFAPELSADRRIATLPIGGGWTLGTRVLFENCSSHLLSDHFPLEFKFEAEEGITETIVETLATNWRPILRPVGWTPPGSLDASEVMVALSAHAHPDSLSLLKRALLWLGGVVPRG